MLRLRLRSLFLGDLVGPGAGTAIDRSLTFDVNHCMGFCSVEISTIRIRAGDRRHDKLTRPVRILASLT